MLEVRKMKAPMVYIAGPLTQDVLVGTRNAILEASILADLGLIPMVPHLTTVWQMIAPRDYDHWMRLCFGWLERCDALLRIPGASKGADAEVSHAHSVGIPVFVEREHLLGWVLHHWAGPDPFKCDKLGPKENI